MQKGEMIEYKGCSLLKLDGKYYAQINGEEIGFYNPDRAVEVLEWNNLERILVDGHAVGIKGGKYVCPDLNRYYDAGYEFDTIDAVREALTYAGQCENEEAAAERHAENAWLIYAENRGYDNEDPRGR